MPAGSEEIRAWFRDQLTARGWSCASWGKGSRVRRSLWTATQKGHQELAVRDFGRAADRPAWMQWPPNERDDADIHYDVILDAGQPPNGTS